MKLGPYLLGPNDTPENGIYTGDARELTHALPSNSVDIIFTSPPYNAKIDYENWDDNLPESEFWDFQECWLEEAFRVAKPNSRLYATIGDSMLWLFRPLAQRIGWRFHQILVWCKSNLVGGGRITKDWNMTAEWCLLFHKGKRTKMQLGADGVVTHNWIVAASAQSNFKNEKRKVHPAQMPLEVAYAWLSRTPGNVVLDPFIGSGTTAMAAKMLGKRFLGFEIGPQTAQDARGRVANTQPPLPGLVAVQESLAL